VPYSEQFLFDRQLRSLQRDDVEVEEKSDPFLQHGATGGEFHVPYSEQFLFDRQLRLDPEHLDVMLSCD